MSFREKIHWVTLVTMILAFGWYFLLYPWRIVGSPAGVMATAGMLVPVTIAIIVAMTIATAFLAIRSPREAEAREDERDRDFHLRGTHFGYYPLVIGIWINIFLIFWGIGQAEQLNLMIATLVVAELVRIGTQLYLYRRGY
ncbi:hypothetical protein [Sphingopyxis sp. USTB-05]|jgi:hypothetical protein|uniref:hypothetical protein n=1 Tax=Sphingopyxis sp. USTB-05 TaxID=2830667 RepID=UPI0020787582|nr:hypothetical protein [Sphingopyxis sp. USTB-05]USI76009.1 hypothetical protein KEC45_14695 [Sphingopyxis sp. USTB-05]